jgi:putative phage-type endonuclease
MTLKLEDFHSFRKKGICGSDISAICGISPWSTPLDVYMRIVDGVEKEITSPAIEWGTLLEPIILSKYEGEKEVDLETNIQSVHKDYPFIRGNIDGFCRKTCGIVEAKTSNFRFKQKWLKDDQWSVPLNYKLQVYWYAMIQDAQSIDVAVLFGLDDFNIITLDRNLKLESALLKKAIDFWEKHILAKKPPAPQTVADLDYEEINEGSEIEATDEIWEATIALNIAKDRLKEQNDKIKKLEKDIKLFMGNHEILKNGLGHTLATFRQFNRKSVNTEAMKNDGIYNDYCKELTYKRMRVKK